MKRAIESAKISDCEIPVGAIILKDGQVIASASNKKESLKDVTCHAEILAIREAERVLDDWRLDDCEMYVTLEPCPMCAWAILNAGIPKVYFGAYDTVYGSLGTAMDLRNYLHSKTDVVGGILEEECSKLLKDYFKEIR